MDENNYAYLVMVTNDSNHNKYYRMVQNGGTFVAEYGRVGASPQRKVYPMSRWFDIYRQKVAKGYTDQTHLHAAATVKRADGYAEIADSAVRWLVDVLMAAAKQTVKTYYRASADEVTQAMVMEAGKYIRMLDAGMGVREFNEILLDLFAVIPRRMANVNDALAHTGTANEYAAILEREQGILDALAGQVFTNGKVPAEEDGGGSKMTVLDSVGLSIRPCTDKENREIIEHMSPESAVHFKQAFRVYNKEVSQRLEKYMADNHIRKAHYYYHGSRTCNYWNIMAMGLDINPNALTAGKMFGNGTYFANRAKKSMRYTDLPGQNNVHYGQSSGDAFLSVFKVAYKKAQHIQKWAPGCRNLDYAKVAAQGCDAVFAHKGADLVNDEIIVYQNCQSAPQYLIALK